MPPLASASFEIAYFIADEIAALKERIKGTKAALVKWQMKLWTVRRNLLNSGCDLETGEVSIKRWLYKNTASLTETEFSHWQDWVLGNYQEMHEAMSRVRVYTATLEDFDRMWKDKQLAAEEKVEEGWHGGATEGNWDLEDFRAFARGECREVDYD